jgi:surface protein
MKKLILLFCLIALPLQAQFIATVGSGGTTETAPFQFTILTLEADDTFTPPIYNGGTYDFTIDWGDLSSSEITSYDDADLTHTYEDEGATEYNISISGTLIGWEFDNAGDKALMKVITQWGCFRPGNSGDWFKGCGNMTITASDRLNLSGVTDMNEAFELCDEITTISGINDWDVSAVTTFYGMFHTCLKFESDIGDWNTGSCTNMGYMFYHCDAFNQDIGDWDTADVTSMTWMFYDAAIFNQDLGDWDTGKVTTMGSMFHGCVIDQDFSTWDITSLTNAEHMFYGVTLSTANYDALLIGWEAQTEKTGVTFSGGNSKYSAGAAATARGVLENTSTWTITDGGQEAE